MTESVREIDLYEEIQAIAAQYPLRQSAVMPALRLAQEKHGWLPPEAFREVAEALDLTPAYCKAVASFYDMFQLSSRSAGTSSRSARTSRARSSVPSRRSRPSSTSSGSAQARRAPEGS